MIFFSNSVRFSMVENEEGWEKVSKLFQPSHLSPFLEKTHEYSKSELPKRNQRLRSCFFERKKTRFLIFGLIWDKWSLHLNGQHTEASTILNIKRGYLGKQRTDRRIIYVRHLVFYVRAPNGNFPIESFAQIRFIYFCFSTLFPLPFSALIFWLFLFLAFRSFFAVKNDKKSAMKNGEHAQRL